MTNQQKELFSDLGDNIGAGERKEIAERENTQRAMVDMAARVIPELQKVELGGENLAEKILTKTGVASSEDA